MAGPAGEPSGKDCLAHLFMTKSQIRSSRDEVERPRLMEHVIELKCFGSYFFSAIWNIILLEKKIMSLRQIKYKHGDTLILKR